MTATTHHTVDVPGAVLHYDVRPAEGDASVLLMIGSPMGAGGFVTLASHFPDRTVVTYDPRGVERSERTDPAMQSTPDLHADDLHRLVQALDAGPVDVFASSGGAVNALALVAAHPDDVSTLVAHEPPAADLLPDRVGALAVCRDISDTYQRDGMGAAMARFISAVTHKGLFPDELPGGPGPDPAVFGLPTEDDGSRDDVLLGQNMLTCTHHQHDLEAVRAASTRVVIAAGEGSEGEMAHRGALAVAERLGTPVAMFPGDHGGFLGGEYGRAGEPDAFAERLREVLATA